MNSEINYTITEYDGIKIIKLIGNISNTTKVEFERIVNSISQKNDVILNMNEISIITSGGLGSLVKVSAEARKRKRRVMIMGLREGLVKMLEVMGALQHIIFIENIEEGLSKT